MRTPRDPIYAGHRYPAEIISYAVWLYFRYPLSLRMVEEMLAARGISVTYETIRQWGLKFGREFANRIRRRAPRRGDKWHLDEVVVSFAGKKHWLWRAVDQDGFVLDVLVQSGRDKKAAKRLFRKLLKKQARAPRVLITAKLSETVHSNPFLPAKRKWPIRFNAGGTVTIVLGMRDYGRGLYSGSFAGLVTARLGVPFRRVRIYYSATLPAVLQTPLPSSMVFHRSHIGPVATAAADVIETMCDQVVERGRVAFAAMAGVGPGDVGFDQLSGQFFVLDRNRSGRILEIDASVRGRSSVSTEFAWKLQRADMHPVSKETQPSAA